MEKITLRNFKGEVILGILAIILGIVILYWGLAGDMKLKISGASLDKSTSAILLCLISVGPILVGINYIMKYISILRYGEFVIDLTKEGITFPEGALFRGFKPVTIQKNLLTRVELAQVATHEYKIYLKNTQGHILGIIEGELSPHKTLPVKDLAIKIQNWLNTN